MKYKQIVTFEKEFSIEAANAQEANNKLEDMVRDIEWDHDLRHDGVETFEDEPINCPQCKGDGCIDEHGTTCPLCKGETSVPFGTVYESK
jgi:RecJ-like exonuclease